MSGHEDNQGSNDLRKKVGDHIDSSTKWVAKNVVEKHSDDPPEVQAAVSKFADAFNSRLSACKEEVDKIISKKKGE